MKPGVVPSVRGAGAVEALRTIAGLPQLCRLIELRADRLSADDVRKVVAESRRELIVTARRPADGGEFAGDETSRRALLEAALAAGARYVDLEWEGRTDSWQRGIPAQRKILSHHGSRPLAGELSALYEAMAAERPAVIKIVPSCSAAADAFALEALLRRAAREGQPLACFGLGRYGLLSRLLSCAWGGWATYGAVGRGEETASGQPTVDELLNVYAVQRITDTTRRFALFGEELGRSPSPAMHRAAYEAHELDAVYLPIELHAVEECQGLVGGLGLSGFAATVPFKEAIAERCVLDDELARRSGSVNTVTLVDGSWRGCNTDGPAAVALVSRQLDPRSCRVAVAGAGGTGKALAHAFHQAGARLCIFNRNVDRARDLAAQVGGEGFAFDELARAEWDVLVQATTLGRDGERWLDPASLRGRVVLEANYGAEPTPLIRDAQAAGLAAIDGLQLLAAQAARQFRCWMGRSIDESRLLAAATQWQTASSG